MPDASTPNYSYTLPTVGMDRDTWGDLENANWSKLDTDLKSVSDSAGSGSSALTTLINNIRAYIEPIGSIKPWPSPTVPVGWIPCDGGAISRTDFAALFAVIGTTWGAGNGSTTFSLPNFVGRVLLHRDNGSWFVGTLGGEFNHTLTTAEMPSHNHPGSFTDVQGDHTHTYTFNNPVTGAQFNAAGFQSISGQSTANTGTAGNHAHNINLTGQGGGGAHNNTQPSVGVMWIIKAANQI